MAALLDDADLEDAVIATQDAALDRLLARDFGGTLLRFVDQVRGHRPASGAGSPLRLLGACSTRPSGSRSCASSVRRSTGPCPRTWTSEEPEAGQASTDQPPTSSLQTSLEPR